MKFYTGLLNFLLLTLAFCPSAFAQAPINRLYGTYGTETGKTGFVRSDSTIYALGTSSAFIDMSSQVYLMKADASGNLLWSMFYGDAGVDDATDMYYHTDTCIYIVANSYQGSQKGYDIRVIKTDLNGTVIWNRTYGSNEWDVPTRISRISDSSFAVCGHTFANTAGLADGMVFAFNEDGDSLWFKNTGTAQDDFLYDIALKNTDTIVAVGEHYTAAGKKQGWIMEMEILGAGMRSYYYGDTFNYAFNALAPLPSGDYGIGLTTDTINGVQNNIYIWKIGQHSHDITVNIWNYAPGDEYCVDLINYGNSFFILANTTSYGLGGYDMLLYRFDTVGWFMASYTYGTNLNNYGSAVFINNHGSCTMVGTSPNSFGPQDLWIVNLNAAYGVYGTPDAGFDPNNVQETHAENNGLVVYPNPAQEGFNLLTDRPVETVLLFDRSGRMVNTYPQPEKYISLTGVSQGLYLVQVKFTDGGNAFTKIMVK